MYENHHDFEALFQSDRNELERKLEERRKLLARYGESRQPGYRGKLFLVLQAFRNILKQ